MQVDSELFCLELQAAATPVEPSATSAETEEQETPSTRPTAAKAKSQPKCKATPKTKAVAKSSPKKPPTKRDDLTPAAVVSPETAALAEPVKRRAVGKTPGDAEALREALHNPCMHGPAHVLFSYSSR